MATVLSRAAVLTVDADNRYLPGRSTISGFDAADGASITGAASLTCTGANTAAASAGAAGLGFSSSFQRKRRRGIQQEIGAGQGPGEFDRLVHIVANALEAGREDHRHRRHGVGVMVGLAAHLAIGQFEFIGHRL